MDRLEKAKVHKAIDDVLTDHHPGMRATRVMIRELILDALEGAGFTLHGDVKPLPAEIEDADIKTVRAIERKWVHPTDNGKRFHPEGPTAEAMQVADLERRRREWDEDQNRLPHMRRVTGPRPSLDYGKASIFD